MLTDLLQYISLDKNLNKKFKNCKVEDLILDIIKRTNLKKEQYHINLDGISTLPMRSFHLEILLDNFINNAIKFKEEEKTLKLEILLNKNQNDYTFKISDNGIGIEDKYKAQIFEIFKRLNKNKSSGTGIGLSICKKIIQSYAGNIWVENNSMGGTTLCFTIPDRKSTT